MLYNSDLHSDFSTSQFQSRWGVSSFREWWGTTWCVSSFLEYSRIQRILLQCIYRSLFTYIGLFSEMMRHDMLKGLYRQEFPDSHLHSGFNSDQHVVSHLFWIRLFRPDMSVAKNRTWFSCSHMVVKTLLYCTRKRGCMGGCMSASCFLQPPCNGSTGQVSVLEHETFSRTLLNFL